MYICMCACVGMYVICNSCYTTEIGSEGRDFMIHVEGRRVCAVEVCMHV